MTEKLYICVGSIKEGCIRCGHHIPHKYDEDTCHTNPHSLYNGICHTSPCVKISVWLDLDLISLLERILGVKKWNVPNADQNTPSSAGLMKMSEHENISALGAASLYLK